MRTTALQILMLATAPSMAGANGKVPMGDDIIAALNRMRADPRAYADQLDRRRRWFIDAHVYQPPDDEIGIQTVEGPDAVAEAATALRRITPLPPILPSPRLAAAALQLAREQGQTGALGHRDSAGRGPGDRVKALGGDIFVAEVINYGHGSANDVIMALLIDDGVPRRGHRITLLDRQHRFAGAGCAVHPRYRMVCVIDLSTGRDGNYVPPDL